MLAHQEEGHIVNTASVAALMPRGGPYGVSKHAVLALSQGLHRDLKARAARIGASVLCPGFVDTPIHDAERNRPDELATGVAWARGMLEGTKAMLARGRPASEIADEVFASIQADRFYVLTHPAWDRFVRSRIDCILNRSAPLVIEKRDMARRRAAGEQF
jgi:NAD(P)-dependent dehydrogenase (short-subunit alcohol dehydrogenase family)